MNISSSAAASAANSAAASAVAGTSRAAAKGGASDQTAIDSQDAVRKTETGGVEKTEATAKIDMDADRDADGRQLLDVFEHHEETDEEAEARESEESDPQIPQNKAANGHLDLDM